MKENTRKTTLERGRELLAAIDAAAQRIGLGEGDVRDQANALLEAGKITAGTMWRLGWYVGTYRFVEKYPDLQPTEEETSTWCEDVQGLIDELAAVSA